MLHPRARLVFPLLAALALAVGCGQGDDGRAPTPAAAPPVEDAVALVNGTAIRAAALEQVVDAERARRAETGDGPAAGEDVRLRREALDLLVAAELLYQAASASGIVVAPEEVDRRLNTARSQFESEAAFARHLAQADRTVEDLRRQAARELLVEAYVRSVTGGVESTDLRARELYEAQRERFAEPEEVRVAHIIVLVRPQDPPERREEARSKIAEAHRRAVAGEDFAQLAREYSESPFAERGGDLGFFPRGRALPEFEEVVFASPPGQITPVFETPYGFNVAQVLERRGGAVRPFEEVRGALRMVLARDLADEALRRHVRELRERAEVRVLDPLLAPS